MKSIRERLTQDDVVQRFNLMAGADNPVAPEPDTYVAQCLVCNDVGKIYHPTTDIYDPQYGKTIYCPQRCQAYRVRKQAYLNRLINHLEKLTGLKERENDVGFDDYTIGAQNHTARTVALNIAYDFVEYEYVNLMNIDKNWIVITGEYGSGKTYLASAIVKELQKRLQPVWFSRVDYLIATIQRGYHDYTDYHAEDMLKTFSEIQYLVLDDCNMHEDKQKGLSASKLQLFERLIDYRYMAKLPTIFTMNLNQAEFRQTWGIRTASRVIDNAHWVAIDGVIRNQNPVLNLSEL